MVTINDLFLTAINDGDFVEVERLLKIKPQLVNAIFMSMTLNDKHYKLSRPTALHLAVYLSNNDPLEARNKIISLLLREGANVNQAFFTKQSPLHCAAKTGNLAIIQQLIDHGANVNQTDKNGATPLHYAAGFGHQTTVEALINHGADLTLTDQFNRNVLHYAVSETGHESIAKLLIDFGVDLNTLDNDNLDPFDLAKINDPGQAINLASYAIKHCDFFEAIQNGNIEKLLQLLSDDISYLNTKHFVEIEPQNHVIITPLQFAVVRNQVDVIKLLLTANVDVQQQDINGNTALHYAVILGHQAAFDALLPVVKQQDITIRNVEGHTILHTAVNKNGTDNMITSLHAAGLSVHERDYLGQTPLHLARNKEVAKVLLDLGADKETKDQFGRTPFTRAATKGLREVMKLLQTFVTQASNVNHSHSVFKKVEKKQTPIRRMIQEGRLLMKELKYLEAAKKFQQAMTLLSEEPHMDVSLYKKMQFYYDKSMSLGHSTLIPYIYDSNAPIDTLAVFKSKIHFGTVAPEQLDAYFQNLYQNPLLKPFLDYVAMDFLLNEKANVRMVKDCHDLQTTIGFFQNSSILIKAKNLDDEEVRGTIMHELTHYYFQKAYQNLSKPFFNSDVVRTDELKTVIKEVLINIAKEIESNVDEDKLRKLDTWKIGRGLSAKDDGSSEIRTKILLIYRLYDKVDETIEFPVCLNDLLARGYSLEKLKVLQPFIDFQQKLLIADCQKFNAELTGIIAKKFPSQKNIPV